MKKETEAMKGNIKIGNILTTLKNKARSEITKRRYDNALQLIKCAGNILYETNFKYMDDELEDDLASVAQHLGIIKQNAFYDSTVLFYDGFGLDRRGIAQIYLKALMQHKKVVYVTYKKFRKRIPELLELLRESDSYFLGNGSYISSTYEFAEIIERTCPSAIFFYSFPADVVGVTILNSFKGHRYQINLTDHAFWLGAKAIDTCIEFRDYGASISSEYRNINNMVKIPYYPIVDRKQDFQGFPFDARDKKVIFSGGSLYKTQDNGNTYYKIIEHILATYPDVIFWYAGSGDRTEIDKILKKYPDRAYITPERSDLLQVIEHCYFYLSTYPICGALMFQYAAMGGKVPLTLKFDSVSDEILVDQNHLGVEFENLNGLYNEIDHMICDEEYAVCRGEQMRNAVITEEKFAVEVSKLFTGDRSSYPISINKINTEAFKKLYSDRIDYRRIAQIVYDKKTPSVLKYLPVEYLYGGGGANEDEDSKNCSHSEEIDVSPSIRDLAYSKSSETNIMLLGAAGFIGTNLAISLASDKNNSITVVSTDLNHCRAIEEKGFENVKCIKNSMSNETDFEKLIANQNVIYHLISTNVPATSNQHISQELMSNVVLSSNLLDACVKNGVRKVIFLSSGGTVYGTESKCPLDEEIPTNPITSYGIQKITIEKLLYLYNYLYGLDYRVVRLSNPYGPYQRPNGVLGAVTTFTYKALKHETIEVYGDGSVVRDFIYIDDAIRGISSIVNKEGGYKTYNLGSGHGTSINELLDTISYSLKIKLNVVYTPRRKVDVPVNYLDISRFESSCGKLNPISLKEGIRKTAEFMLEQKMV